LQFAFHKKIADEIAEVNLLFCQHPMHSWERGANARMINAISLRQYFPKPATSTLSEAAAETTSLETVEDLINSRPSQKG